MVDFPDSPEPSRSVFTSFSSSGVLAVSLVASFAPALAFGALFGVVVVLLAVLVAFAFAVAAEFVFAVEFDAVLAGFAFPAVAEGPLGPGLTSFELVHPMASCGVSCVLVCGWRYLSGELMRVGVYEARSVRITYLKIDPTTPMTSLSSSGDVR